MKLTVLQENLLPKVAAVARVASAKSALPVLENILLSAEKGKVTLSATDLETGISTTVGAKVEQAGSLTVPARVLASLVGSLPPGKITLSVGKDILKVETATVSSKINSLPAEEFPSFSVEGKKVAVLKGKEFKEAIDQVSPAVAQDESRPILTGVFFQLTADGLTLAAVDGFRLAEKRLKVAGKKDVSLVVPVRGLVEVSRLLSGRDVEVLLPEPTQLLFRADDFAVFMQSLEGEFPDYKQIIPSNFETKIRVEKEELVKAVQLTTIFSDKGAGIVRLAFDPGKGSLEVSSEEPELGNARISVEVKGEGKSGKIAFNSRYLMGALGALGAEEIELSLNSPLDPALFRSPSDSSYLHIVMPVRLQE